MSYTTLFKVPESGEIETFAEFKNAYGGAFNVWSEMAERYLGMNTLPIFGEDGMRPVWDLYKASSIHLNDRIVMASTFDRVMVKREHLQALIDAFRDFANRFEPGHLLEQADALERLVNDPTCYAVCWNQTSVNADAWQVFEDNNDDEDSNYRMYDISRDNEHWFLFDKMSLPERS